MSVPKLQWDGKVNIATLIMILAGILAIGAQQAQAVAANETLKDHEARLRTVESYPLQLATMQGQINHMSQTLERIDRRMEERK